MSVDRMVMAFAGSVILLSLILAHTVSSDWLWLTAFVGANLLQASITGLCPLAKILKAVGVRAGCAFE